MGGALAGLEGDAPPIAKLVDCLDRKLAELAPEGPHPAALGAPRLPTHVVEGGRDGVQEQQHRDGARVCSRGGHSVHEPSVSEVGGGAREVGVEGGAPRCRSMETIAPWELQFDPAGEHCARELVEALYEVLVGHGAGEVLDVVGVFPESTRGEIAQMIASAALAAEVRTEAQRILWLHSPEGYCFCMSTAWEGFTEELDDQMWSLGTGRWVVRRGSHLEALDHLSAVELSTNRLWGYDHECRELSVSWDGRALTVEAGGRRTLTPVEDRRRVVVYDALSAIGQPEALSAALECHEAHLDLAVAIAQHQGEEAMWVADREVVSHLEVELSPAEAEIAAALASSWKGSLAELLTAAQACVAAA